MKEKSCCFTDIKPYLSVIGNQLEKTLIEYINEGYRYFGSCGALGFYTLSTETIIKLKERCPYIKLKLILLCISQTKGWMESDIWKYNNINLKQHILFITQKHLEIENTANSYILLKQAAGKVRFIYKHPLNLINRILSFFRSIY